MVGVYQKKKRMVGKTHAFSITKFVQDGKEQFLFNDT